MKKSLLILSFVSVALAVIAINSFACGHHSDKNNDNRAEQSVDETKSPAFDEVQENTDFLPGNIIAFSDDMQTLMTWKQALADNTGKEVYCCDFNGSKAEMPSKRLALVAI